MARLSRLLAAQGLRLPLAALQKFYAANRAAFALPEFAGSAAAGKPPIHAETGGEKADAVSSVASVASVASMASMASAVSSVASVASTNDASSLSVASDAPSSPPIGSFSDPSARLSDAFLLCALSLQWALRAELTRSLATLRSQPLDAPELRLRASLALLSELLAEFWATPVQRLLASRRSSVGLAAPQVVSASSLQQSFPLRLPAPKAVARLLFLPAMLDALSRALLDSAPRLRAAPPSLRAWVGLELRAVPRVAEPLFLLQACIAPASASAASSSSSSSSSGAAAKEAPLWRLAWYPFSPVSTQRGALPRAERSPAGAARAPDRRQRRRLAARPRLAAPGAAQRAPHRRELRERR